MRTLLNHQPTAKNPCMPSIFWLKNRKPNEWRDSRLLEHVPGKYIISDQPMTEEQWARERATVIDAEPSRFGDGREEKHLAKGPSC
jgi:hypothetical protein